MTGNNQRRPDAARHVRGRGRFTDDLVPPDAAHVTRQPFTPERILEAIAAAR